MKRTKLLALALAGVMVLALLTGCGKTGMNARERAVAEGIAAELTVLGIPITVENLPETKQLAAFFKPSWMPQDGSTNSLNVDSDTDIKMMNIIEKAYPPSRYSAEIIILEIKDGMDTAAEISDFWDQKACYYIIQGGPNLSNRVGKICTTTIKSEGKTYRFMLYLLEDKTVTIT